MDHSYFFRIRVCTDLSLSCSSYISQLRLKAEQEARDRAQEERLINMMKQKFADDERREREETIRRKKEKERVRHQSILLSLHSCMH